MRRMLAACALLLTTASPGRATVLIPIDLGELARDAQAIVRGRVVAVEGHWTDDRRTIETLVTLEVERSLKGGLGPTVAFLVPGGRLGRYRSIVVGAPSFAAGDRVLVFLGARGPSIPFLVGFSQGVYRLVPTDDRSGWLVTPPALAATGADPVPIVRGDPARRPVPLAEFEDRVGALAGGSR